MRMSPPGRHIFRFRTEPWVCNFRRRPIVLATADEILHRIPCHFRPRDRGDRRSVHGADVGQLSAGQRDACLAAGGGGDPFLGDRGAEARRILGEGIPGEAALRIRVERRGQNRRTDRCAGKPLGEGASAGGEATRKFSRGHENDGLRESRESGFRGAEGGHKGGGLLDLVPAAFCGGRAGDHLQGSSERGGVPCAALSSKRWGMNG